MQKKQLCGWRSFLLVYLCALFTVSSSWAMVFVLPDGVKVTVEQKLDDGNIVENHHIETVSGDEKLELKLFKEEKGYLETEAYKHSNRNGVGFICLSSKSEEKCTGPVRYKGRVEVVVIGVDSESDLSTLLLPDRMKASCLQQSSRSSSDGYLDVTVPSSKSMAHFYCSDIPRNKVDFRQLLIRGADEQAICVPGRLLPDQKADMFSAIVIRFKPNDSSYPVELFVHLADVPRVQEAQAALTEMSTVLRKSEMFDKLKAKALPLRGMSLNDEFRKKGTWGFSRLIQRAVASYYYGYFPGSLFPSFDDIPREGIPAKTILETVKLLASEENKEWVEGLISGSIYSGDLAHYRFLGEGFTCFAHTNLIQRHLNVSGAYFEDQVVNMLLNMLHAPNMPVQPKKVVSEDSDEESSDEPAKVVVTDPTGEGDLGVGFDQDLFSSRPSGVITPGGTDSIKAALLACRNVATRSPRYKGIKRFEVIVPRTAHPAFRKGAEACGMDLIYAEVDKTTFKVDTDDVRAKINHSTILIVGSAFSYPHGVVDNISALADLAREFGLFLHVDGCLGGFPLHWLQEIRQAQLKEGVQEGDDDLVSEVPLFDFSIPEVTSISIDTHKYGYSLKGSSVILFRTKMLKDALAFVEHDWPGGFYLTTNQQGSTCVGNFTAAWMALLKTGKAGYEMLAYELHHRTRDFAEIIGSYPELEVIGVPYTQVCFKAKDKSGVSILHVNDSLNEDGWQLTVCQNPPVLRFCVTGPQIQNGNIVERFEASMRKAVEHARVKGTREKANSASFYGLAKYGVNLESRENKEAFAKTAIQLMGASSNQPDDSIVEDFKQNWKRELYSLLGITELEHPHCGRPDAFLLGPFMGRPLVQPVL
ncbi:pyridoxal phosphate-dependent decarboxylase family protein [Spongorhabdus nitratireducens]